MNKKLRLVSGDSPQGVTYEEFTRLRTAVLGGLDASHCMEWWGSEKVIMSELLETVERALFHDHLVEQKERAVLADLINKYGVPK